MASLKEVKRVTELCEKYELEGRDVIKGYTNTQLGSMYNGIGPEKFPGWLRAVLDALHPSLAPVAFIHDIEWSLSDGTKASFTESNRRFKRNGYKVAKAMYGVFNPRRYKVMWDAAKFARVCQRFGWAAWMAPFTAKDVEAQRMSAPLIATPSGRSSTGGYAVILASTKAEPGKLKRTRKRTAEAPTAAGEEAKA